MVSSVSVSPPDEADIDEEREDGKDQTGAGEENRAV